MAYQNFIAQYLNKEWMEFDTILNMDWNLQDIGWDCFASNCEIYYRVMDLDSSQNFVPIEYLMKEWKEVNKILHMHLY